MATLKLQRFQPTNNPHVHFQILLPDKWSEVSTAAEDSTLEQVNQPSCFFEIRDKADQSGLKVTAIPIEARLNPIDLALCGLLKSGVQVDESGGYDSPVGKIGRFAFKRSGEASAEIHGRIFATRNANFVLMFRMESVDPDVDLDAMVESIELDCPNYIELEPLVTHAEDKFSLGLPESWQMYSKNESELAFSHSQQHDVLLFVSRRNSSPFTPHPSHAQSIVEHFLLGLAKYGISYSGAALVPAPEITMGVRRFRFQTACQNDGCPANLLLMHHDIPGHDIPGGLTIAACIPDALENPTGWAYGKFGMESALTSLSFGR